MYPFCSRPVPRWLRAALPAVLFCGLLAATSSAQSGKKRATPTPTPPVSAPSPSATPYTLPGTVATVDGNAIPSTELTRVTDTLLQSNGRALKDLSPADQRRVFQSVLDDMVIDRILMEKSAGETVADMDVETQFNVLRNQYPTPEAFETELKKSGQTPEVVRRNIHLQLGQKQWIERQITNKVKTTPEEIEKFYKEGSPGRFDAPEMVKARQILVKVTREAPPEDALEAEKKVKGFADRIKKGEAFEAVAKSSSEDPTAKNDGGEMDYFTRDRIMPEFADAAFKLKVGEVSAPVRTQFGYHLIKLTDRKPAHHATFDEVKGQIGDYLSEEKRKEAVATLIQSLRDNAKVEIFVK